jgi:hypothetical protein
MANDHCVSTWANGRRPRQRGAPRAGNCHRLISSHELAVSQSLRAVKGCTCVVNQLQVGTTQHDGRAHALVSADGRLLVPDGTAVKPAVYPMGQAQGSVSPVAHQEETKALGRWAPYNPLRVFGRSSAPARTETPKTVAPSNLPPSMQFGAYQNLAGKTPKPVSAAASTITPAVATAPQGESVTLEQRIARWARGRGERAGRPRARRASRSGEGQEGGRRSRLRQDPRHAGVGAYGVSLSMTADKQ